MKDCEHCVEGLVSQGESIHQVCVDCKGTGKVGEELSEVEASAPAEEVEGVGGSDESFLGEASDDSVSSSEDEVV